MLAKLEKVLSPSGKDVQLVFTSSDPELMQRSLNELRLMQAKPVDLYFHLRLTADIDPQMKIPGTEEQKRQFRELDSTCEFEEFVPPPVQTDDDDTPVEITDAGRAAVDPDAVDTDRALAENELHTLLMVHPEAEERWGLARAEGLDNAGIERMVAYLVDLGNTPDRWRNNGDGPSCYSDDLAPTVRAIFNIPMPGGERASVPANTPAIGYQDGEGNVYRVDQVTDTLAAIFKCSPEENAEPVRFDDLGYPDSGAAEEALNKLAALNGWYAVPTAVGAVDWPPAIGSVWISDLPSPSSVAEVTGVQDPDEGDAAPGSRYVTYVGLKSPGSPEFVGGHWGDDFTAQTWRERWSPYDGETTTAPPSDQPSTEAPVAPDAASDAPDVSQDVPSVVSPEKPGSVLLIDEMRDAIAKGERLFFKHCKAPQVYELISVETKSIQAHRAEAPDVQTTFPINMLDKYVIVAAPAEVAEVA